MSRHCTQQEDAQHCQANVWAASCLAAELCYWGQCSVLDVVFKPASLCCCTKSCIIVWSWLRVVSTIGFPSLSKAVKAAFWLALTCNTSNP
jgi:hypothetical protein